MKNTVYVFIDASNLWAVQKTKGHVLDIKNLISYLKTEFNAKEIKVYYYDAYPAEGTREYDTSGKHKFYTYLKKALGVVVRKKELKRIESADSKYEDGFVEKGNMDVEIAIDVVSQIKNYDTAIFFSGDSDFLALVKFVRNKNKRVFVYSSRNNVSTELRTGADGYMDVLSIKSNIWRSPIKHRQK